MRILFVTKSHNIYGGVERWLSDLVEGLIRNGWTCIIAVVSGTKFHNADAYIRAHVTLRKAEVREIKTKFGTELERRRQLETAIQDIQPNIVIPVMVHEALGAVSLRRSRGQQVKLLYPIHDSEVWAYDAVMDYKDVIDGIVCVNRLMKEVFVRWADWPENRIFHIRCGVDSACEMAVKGVPSGAVEIGYAGALNNEQKRAHDLLSIIEAIEARDIRYRLHIAGSGRSEDFLKKKLEDRINEGLVVFYGQLSKEEMYRGFYPCIDVLLITSDWETGPLVAWEAMMHGVLVLTSRYRGILMENVLIDGATALIFPVGKSEEAAEMLRNVCAEPDRFIKMANKGREVAEWHLHVDGMVEKWNAALHRLSGLPVKVISRDPGRHYPSYTESVAKQYLRCVLRKPVQHTSAHEEWPRFKPGYVQSAIREAFLNRLDALESDLAIHHNERVDAAR